ncbi:hypothetical protein OQA88_2800 [Cercophora sp. LCS_1]
MPSQDRPDATPTRPERPTRVSYLSNYSDKPLPEPRPGTSDTAELQLHIQRMSEELRQARISERLYRARKRVATGRTNRTEAKAHFRQSVQHLKLGVRMSWAVLTGLPLYLMEKRKIRGENTGGSSHESSPKKEKKETWKGKLAMRSDTPDDVGGASDGKME